jgi:hypothetical protein
MIVQNLIVSPVVLCGCETWSLRLRKERRLRALRVFENRMMIIFGPKRDEIGWRKLHNEELYNL